MRKKPDRNGRRSAYHIPSHESIDDYVSDPLNEAGLSVFRRLGSCGLDGCMGAFNEYTNGVSKITRSESGQHGMALTIVGLIEVRTKNFDGLVSSQSAINEIYDSIPSLRKSQNIRISRVAMLGHSSAKLRAFGVSIHPDDRELIRDERDQVIEILNDYAQLPLTREDWSFNDVPHISIGRVSMTSISEDQRRVLITRMNEALPEQIQLDRATLYNPAK